MRLNYSKSMFNNSKQQSTTYEINVLISLMELGKHTGYFIIPYNTVRRLYCFFLVSKKNIYSLLKIFISLSKS